MNLLLLHPHDLQSGDDGTARRGDAVVNGERLLHLRKVLRSKAGDRVRVGMFGGLVGFAIIQTIDRNSATLRFDLTEAPPQKLAVELAVALPRPKFVGRIIQHATAAGVEEITFFNSDRVERSYWSSQVLESTRLERHVRLGLEQARDTVPPRLRLVRSFAEMVDRVSHTVGSRAVWLAHESAQRKFPRAPSGTDAVLIGPEGGFLREEVRRLEQAGATPGSLGQRPLRVEAAVTACLARLMP